MDTLSSFTVESCRVSKVTSAIIFPRVRLSRKECARTMAPDSQVNVIEIASKKDRTYQEDSCRS